MIARRYAKALVNLAEKEHDLDYAGKNLTAITDVYKENYASKNPSVFNLL